MTNGGGVPIGFTEDFTKLSRTAIMRKYDMPEKRFRELAASMPFKLREHRQRLQQAHALENPGGYVWGQKPTPPDKLETISIGCPKAAALRMADLIEKQRAATAATPDPYAGLTGFERQLAIAKAKGVTATVRLPTRVSSVMDTGLGMSSSGWAVGGGAGV